MSLKIEIKSVYGSVLIYPVCETAKKMTQLIGTKTLSNGHVKILRELGYSIEVITPVSQLLNA